MALITWTQEQYGTNVGFADEEHKKLFGLLNKLYDEATSGAPRVTIGSSLDALIAYVVDHFAHEEKEMQSTVPMVNIRPSMTLWWRFAPICRRNSMLARLRSPMRLVKWSRVGWITIFRSSTRATAAS